MIRPVSSVMFFAMVVVGCQSAPQIKPGEETPPQCTVEPANGDNAWVPRLAQETASLPAAVNANRNTDGKKPIDITVDVLAPPSGGGERITPEEADTVVRELRERKLVERSNGKYAPMQYDQFQNDCEDRAHVGASYVLATRPGWAVGKVFLSGGLSMFGGEIGWGYHVAPYVVVSNELGEIKDLLVLDPALNGMRAMSLADWVKAATDSSKSDAKLKVHLTRAESWTFRYASRPEDGHPDDGPAPNQTQRTFCSDVKQARAYLTQFAERTPHIVTHLWGVRVGELKKSGHVTFKGTHKTYGPFMARKDIQEVLEKARKEDSRLHVIRQRLYNKNVFKNFWRWMFGGPETIKSIEVDEVTPSGGDAELNHLTLEAGTDGAASVSIERPFQQAGVTD